MKLLISKSVNLYRIGSTAICLPSGGGRANHHLGCRELPRGQPNSSLQRCCQVTMGQLEEAAKTTESLLEFYYNYYGSYVYGTF